MVDVYVIPSLIMAIIVIALGVFIFLAFRALKVWYLSVPSPMVWSTVRAAPIKCLYCGVTGNFSHGLCRSCGAPWSPT